MFRNIRKRLGLHLLALTITLMLLLIIATVVSAGGPVVHRVSVGSPDACTPEWQPGCDANFSLVAIEFADGSVTGQYTDQFGFGFGGFHATIDCLYVDGNQAWVSGVITHGFILGYFDDMTGMPVSTRVVDNGTSANDPADQISYSYITEGVAFPCTEHPDVDLFDLMEGQVRVK